MAYNVAANLRQTRPGAAFLDARDNVQRNALAERQQVGAEQQQALAQENALFNRQRLQEQDQIAAQDRTQAAEADERTQLFNYFSHLSKLRDHPEQFAATSQRMLKTPLFQKHQIAPEDLTLEEIDQILPVFAAQAGVAPAAEQDKWEPVAGTPRGSRVVRNARTGEEKQVVGADNTETPNYGRGAPQRQPPAGYDWGPDGGLVVIPGGPADKTNDAPKPATEGDKRARVMYSSMKNAEKQIEAVTAADTSNLGQAILGKIRAGKVLQSDEYKRYEAAGLRFAANLLYLKSGATATPDEIQSTWRQFFPQIGDGASVKAQKDEARLQEMAAINDAYTFGDAYQPAAPAPAEAAGGIPPANARGWPLMTDANGNSAYVSPDGKQFEEVR